MGFFSLKLSQLSYSGSCIRATPTEESTSLEGSVVGREDAPLSALSCFQEAVIRKSSLVHLSYVLTHPGGIIKEVHVSCYEFLSSCPKSSVSRALANWIIQSSEREELGLLSQASSGRQARKGLRR